MARQDNSTTPTTTHPPTGYCLTAGGRILCVQCTAKSKRTGVQCGAAAIKGKTKCRVHGGLSSGPKTQAGRDRIAAANTVHGRETRSMRTERKLALNRMYDLESAARSMGLITGPKTGGPRPGSKR
jgi:hypothetical protein